MRCLDSSCLLARERNDMKFITSNEDNKKRLDKFLAEQMPKTTRSQIKKLIEQGVVLINSKKPSVHHFLKENDVVEVNSREETSQAALPEVPIIEQGEGFLVINKPAGLVVHSDKNEPTVVDWLLNKFPEVKEVGDPLRPGIVHRLDKSTSGVMIVATNQKMFDHLKQQFHNRKIKKTYLALVHGNLDQMEGEINKPIGRSHKGTRMAARTSKIDEKDREAITRYQVIKRYKKFDLVEAYPLTGRTHQIRVHLMALGHPLVGDKLYTIHGQKKIINLGRNFLHAAKIEFSDPTGEVYIVSAPLPDELENFLKTI